MEVLFPESPINESVLEESVKEDCSARDAAGAAFMASLMTASQPGLAGSCAQDMSEAMADTMAQLVNSAITGLRVSKWAYSIV